MKDIGLWIAAVILTKVVYYYAVRTIHKDYSKTKIIKNCSCDYRCESDCRRSSISG